MRKNNIYLLLGAFLLVLAISTFAEEPIDMNDICEVNEDCALYGDTSYCNLETGTCFLPIDSEDEEILATEDENIEEEELIECVDDELCNLMEYDYCDLESGFCANEETITILEEDTEFPCTEDEICTSLDFDYCDLETETCIDILEEIEEELESQPNVPGTLNSRTAVLETEVSNLKEKITGLETTSTQINQQLSELSNKIGNTDTSIQIIESQQKQTKEELDKELKSVSTGMAGLQTNLDTTKSELGNVEKDLAKQQTLTKVLTFIFFILLAIAVALGVVYYINGKKENGLQLNQEIIHYITSHIKQGKKYPVIKAHLIKAGWQEKDIDWAYKETMKHNYKNYLQGRVTPGVMLQPKQKQAQNKAHKVQNNILKNVGPDHKKIFSILIVSALLIVGSLLLFKGVTTGKAIHFQSPEELDLAVKDTLEKNIMVNPFYRLVDSVSICVQVEDEEIDTSYKILKTVNQHTIEKIDSSCESDHLNYDLALKFNNWKSFDLLTNFPTCNNFKRINSEEEKNVYILPSKFIEEGFKLNPELNPNQYCKALKQCLSETELRLMGIDCNKKVVATTTTTTTQKRRERPIKEDDTEETIEEEAIPIVEEDVEEIIEETAMEEEIEEESPVVEEENSEEVIEEELIVEEETEPIIEETEESTTNNEETVEEELPIEEEEEEETTEEIIEETVE